MVSCGTWAQTDFDLFCLHPAELGGVAIATAAARSGAVGLLDVSRCELTETASLASAVLQTPEWRSHHASMGLRLRTDQLDAIPGELGASGAPLLVTNLWDREWIGRLNAFSVTHPKASIYVDVHSTRSADLLSELSFTVAGMMASGQEAGGWAGCDSSLILLQNLLARQLAPVFVRGGLGAGGIAACRAAGAAGVVLDEQLLLFPESPLKPEHKSLIRSASVQDAVLVGEPLGAPCRILRSREFPQVKEFRDAALAVERSHGCTQAGRQTWREAASGWLRFGPPEHSLWPIGQAIEFAAAFAEQFRTVGRLLQSLSTLTADRIAAAAAQRIFQSGAPLAQTLGTEFPVVQGPMTRVSDGPDFMAAVCAHGGLPTVALGVMSASEAERVLQACRDRLPGQPWAAGVLGFLEPELLEAHLVAVERVAPAVAVLAGGSAQQALRLEAQGIKAFVHVPSPALLNSFLAQGVRRFVFEGRECGGHVGPIGSVALWELAIERLRTAEPDVVREMQILFAGGIHDAASAANAAIMAAPLVAQGVQCGILMGTAYLFTQEAVRHHAIDAIYQAELLGCRETVTIESAPGHSNRCVATPFVQAFSRERQRLLQAEGDSEAMRAELDRLLLGRLRIAAKGKAHHQAGGVIDVEPEQQREDGMFMIGAAATLRSAQTTLAELHRATGPEAMAYLDRVAASLRPGPREQDTPKASDIAIVGLSVLAPGADDVEQFWQVLLAGQSQIREIPPGRWDWRLYDRENQADSDRISSRWGGFFNPLTFDPTRFGIPPKSVPHIAPAQLLMLEMTRRALVDAGYEDGSFDRENTAVVFGAADAAGFFGNMLVLRSMAPLVGADANPAACERMWSWSEESFVGMLTNVTAGRVANRFDCGGPNLTIDAACASGLSALDVVIKDLESGRINAALVGAVDVGQSPHNYMGFSRTGALSPTGEARVFDQKANGIVTSEAAAVFMLKRLVDAERDGDKIYAVVKAVAGSSDGRAMGMTAPRPLGQMRAMRRAYERSGIPIHSIGLYEAHGTGTKVGDQAESEAYTTLHEEGGSRPGQCVVGSLKSILGHSKVASGLLALAKASLSLYHRTLPPHVGVSQPLDILGRPESPLRLIDRPRPWLSQPVEPRRAAVSAFGFGGTNYHVVLEEYDHHVGAKPVPGHTRWPHELLVLTAATPEGLRVEMERLQQALHNGAQPELRELTAAYAALAVTHPNARLTATAVVSQLADVQAALESLLAHLTQPNNDLPPYLGITERPSEIGLVAFLYPGQGAQYLNMGVDLALYSENMRHIQAAADRLLAPCFDQPFSAYVYPDTAFDEATATANRNRLIDTHVAQPAIGMISLGYTAFLARLGVQPGMVGGHSFGELTALCAAGAFTLEDFLALAERRGWFMAAGSTRGGMAAVRAARSEIEPLLTQAREVVLANHNSDEQVVISGPKEAVEHMCQTIRTQTGKPAVALRVSNAFHSPLMTCAREAFEQTLAGVNVHDLNIPVYRNADARRYHNGEVRQRLGANLTEPVEFVRQIQQMVDDGARLFIEMGPGRTIASMLEKMALGAPVNVVGLDDGTGSWKGLLTGVGALWRAGVNLDLRRLYDHRITCVPALETLLQSAIPASRQRLTWMVDGQSAWPLTTPRNSDTDEPVTYARRPFLNLEAAIQAPVRTDVSVEREVASWPPNVEGQESEPRSEPGAVQAIYQQYAETMRHFLASQERIFASLLGQSGSTGFDPSVETTAEVSHTAHGVESPETPALAGAVDALAAGSDAPLDLRQLLLGTVSEVTGYPQDMLTFGDDIEAELGIDSIKRLEIVDALMRQLDADAALTAPDITEQLPRLKTLQDWLNVLTTTAEHPEKGTAASTSAVVSQAADRPPRPLDWATQIVTVASEVTGYPSEMITLGQDIEAELGIDSIKRLEIIDRLATSLTAHADVERVRGCGESLARRKRFGDWVDLLATQASQPASVRMTPESTVAPCQPDETPAICPRFMMEEIPSILTRAGEQPLSGFYLVTRDALGVADELTALMELRGARTAVIDVMAMGATDWQLAHLTARAGDHRSIDGLIHLAGLGHRALPSSLPEWRDAAHRDVKSLYLLLKALQPHIESRSGSTLWPVVSVSMLGGRFGRDGGQAGSLPTVGGAHGLLTTFEREVPSVVARLVDFSPDASALDISEKLIDELVRPIGRVEVGYVGHRRLAFVPRPVDLTEPHALDGFLPDGAVVLATGGARGITCALLKTLVRPGIHLVVIGRQRLDSERGARFNAYRIATALRPQLIADDRARGITRNPAAIEAEMQEILRYQEATEGLHQLRARGATVEYRSCDVSDAEAFGALIDDVYTQHGRIDLVLHGAGVIEDKLVCDKAPESFDRVFDTKVNSAFALWRHLKPETLQAIVVFASTAGRFGNRGQGDYAAANEVLNRMAMAMQQQWPDVRVIAINWGPWTGVGMAGEVVNQQFKSRGITPITEPAAARFLALELSADCPRAVEIIAGNGPWNRNTRPQLASFFESVSPFVQARPADS